MTIVLRLEDLRSSQMSSQFEGRRHADGADLSFFVTNAPPGSGPSLHTHPYTEVFIVQEGEATFTAGDEELVVTGGNVVVVPPETRHRFENTGEDTLRQVSIHDRGEMQTTWLED
jgi:mannose-6-phosphate isomerase-like protein (cupin superfamily)